MKIKVKQVLTKSRNPKEHKIKLENQIGELIQVVGDGFNLIRFNQFTIIRKNKKEVLEWYIHDMDFFIQK